MTKQPNNLTDKPQITGTIWVNADEIAARFRVSRNTIWRWARSPENEFPDPVRLTPRVTRWRLADIEQFEQIRSEALAA
ncbi:AlpA family phage regulatory protein [Roseibaca sp. V10]|uniref:AlpA family phage regulatory protein n=1 Tax=Roseinatronobacter domitianus TaxID=2940293 RepID=A0ABT0M5G4_9RHOB|nr:AlpA family phage regulatory protein [Roseibaca domitiana]MCL1630106.1 AlpA family phage regulatory protein [Roseibaca domitiana]